MNPLTNVKNITKLNETELASGSIHKKSWHDMYKESAWIFIGGLPYALTEGDILAVFSQYGEIVNINLVRDKKTGKSKGYCFICYSNQKSTVLAVDNFNGIKLCNRTIRVDHVKDYKPPKEDERDDEITRTLKSEGCAPKVTQIGDASDLPVQIKKKKSKKEKKEKKKKKRKHNSDASDSDNNNGVPEIEIKHENHDPGYDKYETHSARTHTNKVKDRERNLDNSDVERFESRENYRSKSNKQCSRSRETDKHRDSDDGNEELRRANQLLRESARRHKENYDMIQSAASSSKNHKRRRSSSLSDNSSGHGSDDDNRQKDERSAKKNKNFASNRKYKSAGHSSSSSTDDDSSTQSSSEDEKNGDDSRYSGKDKHKSYKEKRSYQKESRHKHYRKSEDSDYTSTKSRHYDKREKHSDHKSKRKYESDDSDNTDHRTSHYHKRRQDKM